MVVGLEDKYKLVKCSMCIAQVIISVPLPLRIATIRGDAASNPVKARNPKDLIRVVGSLV